MDVALHAPLAIDLLFDTYPKLVLLFLGVALFLLV